MTIRIMAENDYESAYHLWHTTLGIGISAVDDTRERVGMFLRRNADTCFVAVRQDGTLCGTILAGHDGRRGHIYHLAVAVADRGQGIGRQLVECAMDALRRAGVPKATLVAFTDNASGNRFWEAAGFTTRPDLCYRNKDTSGLS